MLSLCPWLPKAYLQPRLIFTGLPLNSKHLNPTVFSTSPLGSLIGTSDLTCPQLNPDLCLLKSASPSLPVLILGNSTLPVVQPKHLESLFTLLLHTTFYPPAYAVGATFEIHLQLNSSHLQTCPGLNHHHCCLLRHSSLLTSLLSHLCPIHSILDLTFRQLLWKLCHSFT